MAVNTAAAEPDEEDRCKGNGKTGQTNWKKCPVRLTRYHPDGKYCETGESD